MSGPSVPPPRTPLLLPFGPEEYRRRWQRAEAAMRRRGLAAAVVWGRTASTFDRAAMCST